MTFSSFLRQLEKQKEILDHAQIPKAQIRLGPALGKSMASLKLEDTPRRHSLELSDEQLRDLARS